MRPRPHVSRRARSGDVDRLGVSTLDRQGVSAAVSRVHETRSASAAGAGEQAVRWHATASALEVLAEHEADTARAQATRRDAATARRLARGLALTHSDRIAADDDRCHVPEHAREHGRDDIDEEVAEL